MSTVHADILTRARGLVARRPGRCTTEAIPCKLILNCWNHVDNYCLRNVWTKIALNIFCILNSSFTLVFKKISFWHRNASRKVFPRAQGRMGGYGMLMFLCGDAICEDKAGAHHPGSAEHDDAHKGTLIN